jgi:anthranilate phosphoribosyltransferase
MIKEAIATLVGGGSLNMDEAAAVMEEIMEGQATPSQLSAFIVALRIKGETEEEIAGLARTMRAKAVPVSGAGPVVDVVGTGGDRSGTFNISTSAAMVVAAAGVRVAKHGNRAASSRCGSADVLEALGVKLELSADEVRRCLGEMGIAFMFAPSFHPAMKHAGPTRREIGVPTVFTLLGPLPTPAGASSMLLGVSRTELVGRMAGVLGRLGARHVLVVHGKDGLDEITVTGPSLVCELKNGEVREYEISPEDFGMQRAGPEDLKGGTAEENAAIVRGILSGEKGPRRDIVLLNAAAALMAGDRVPSINDGLKLAADVLDDGRALKKLDELISFTRSLS